MVLEKLEVNFSYVMCVSIKFFYCKDKRLRFGVFVIVLFEFDCYIVKVNYLRNCFECFFYISNYV